LTVRWRLLCFKHKNTMCSKYSCSGQWSKAQSKQNRKLAEDSWRIEGTG